MRKFNFFSVEEITDRHMGSHDALCMVNVMGYVNEIPEFENETQALDWYKGVYLVEQKKADDYNNSHTKWYDSKKWNNLPSPENVYVLELLKN